MLSSRVSFVIALPSDKDPFRLHLRGFALLVCALLAWIGPVSAQTIPKAQDRPFPGAMTLVVDATDTDRGIFSVRQTIPVEDFGPLVLFFPEWLPGNHAPRGQVEKLAGLTIRGGGKTLPWRRNATEVYAFHVDVPPGIRALDIDFKFLSATEADQGRIVVTPAMTNIQWQSVSLYPAGYAVSRIPVDASIIYPKGWTAATALRPVSATGATVRYQRVDYETLVDSPVFAGAHFARWPLGHNVTLNVVADESKYLAATSEQIAAHARLVDQAVKLFGFRPWDHYDFLLALTDELGSIGLEHHRSSENAVNPEYFTEWSSGPGRRNLLPHELSHAWVGKYRRPAGQMVDDFATPLNNDLLWVYEGQDQFWGYVLGARSGLFTKQETLDALASIAASLDIRRARDWRGVEDTTRDPIITARRPKGWLSYQRSEDYYNEGMLVWLEVDALLRQKTGGAKGMDDFARIFFAGTEGRWQARPFTLQEIVGVLDGLSPGDWSGQLTRRVAETLPRAPLQGIELGGYRLTYSEEPTPFFRDAERRAGEVNLSFSLGILVGKGGHLTGVIWDSPAFNAGLTTAAEIVAVNGRTYSETVLRDAVAASKGGSEPIRLIVRSGSRVREVALPWTGGHRYPRLEKTAAGDGSLDRLLAARP
jgi:predicted metalloprotease with PDZ domain